MIKSILLGIFDTAHLSSGQNCMTVLPYDVDTTVFHWLQWQYLALILHFPSVENQMNIRLEAFASASSKL